MTPAAQRLDLSIANTRLGRYLIKRAISARSTGRVYAAFDSLLGRRVAVKLLRPELSTEPRLLDDLRATAMIVDPGIVQVFDLDQHLCGSPFVVTELLEGELLEHRLERHAGAVPVEDALPFVRQVASTLGVAHARGIVHRGLEPATIFIARDPDAPTGERPKLLDFGLASPAESPYASPELRSGGRVDARSDVYSLGCVLFMLLTGAPPLASSRRAGVSAEVDELLARCLAPSPAKRFASGAELAAAIDRVLVSKTRESRPTRRMRSAVCTLTAEITGQVKLQAQQASAGVRVLAGVTAVAVVSAITMAVI